MFLGHYIIKEKGDTKEEGYSNAKGRKGWDLSLFNHGGEQAIKKRQLKVKEKYFLLFSLSMWYTEEQRVKETSREGWNLGTPENIRGTETHFLRQLEASSLLVSSLQKLMCSLIKVAWGCSMKQYQCDICLDRWTVAALLDLTIWIEVCRKKMGMFVWPGVGIPECY